MEDVIVLDRWMVALHWPEPLPENLIELSAAVRAHKADIGIAVDRMLTVFVLFVKMAACLVRKEYTW